MFSPGFNAGTPLHGWSMTKTVTGMLAHKHWKCRNFPHSQTRSSTQFVDVAHNTHDAEYFGIRKSDSGRDAPQDHGDAGVRFAPYYRLGTIAEAWDPAPELLWTCCMERPNMAWTAPRPPKTIDDGLLNPKYASCDQWEKYRQRQLF